MAIETQYNIVKVNELRPITTAMGNDEIIVNDVDSFPLETKKITVENFANSIKDYILPIAGEGPNGVLGGVKIGDGLTINPITGVLSNDILVLGDLDDVIILNPEAGQVLKYNGVQWINEADGGVTNVIAGEGLSGGGTGGEIVIDVNAGRGLSIINDAVTVNVNAGLEIVSNYINVRLNTGLTFSDNRITLVLGSGLVVDGGFLTIKVGNGLTFDGQNLVADISDNLTFTGGKIDVPFAQGALDSTPSPDYRKGGIVKIATVEQTIEGTNKTDAITPYTLQAKVGKLPMLKFDCLPEEDPDIEDPEDDEGEEDMGPDNVVIYEPTMDENDELYELNPVTLACNDLTKGSTNYYGVGQIATAFATSMEDYGEGYDTDWLTNNIMAPIIKSINDRLAAIEASLPEPPFEGVRIIKNFSWRDGRPVSKSKWAARTFTWTPVDAENLYAIDIVGCGGGGGAACPSPGYGPAGPGGNGQWQIKRMIPPSAYPSFSLTLTVGNGGRGGRQSFGFNYRPRPGGNTFVPLTDFEDFVSGGGAGFGGAGGITSGVDGPVQEGLAKVGLGGGNWGQPICPNPGGYYARRGTPGGIVIYEHYPIDWVDPRFTADPMIGF